MTVSSREVLLRLGLGESIADVCAAAGWSRARFDDWWRDECRQRVPATTGSQRVGGIHKGVRIERDRFGIPHVSADNNRDLFFGFGYAVAQDRLFQLDYLRRKARGTLAEILGPEAVESDLLARTVGIGRIAEAEWPTLPGDVQEFVSAYAAGINAVIEASRERLPIEFDLLGYAPAPWTPTDSLAIHGEFRWYLTGRFPVIVIPELAKRTLADAKLYEAFLQGELNEESIVWPGEYAPGSWDRSPNLSNADRTGVRSHGNADAGPGSNNWVLAGSRTATGKPIVASDPHVPFYAVSIWHQVRLHGGDFHVAGVALAGMPAVMIGRNRQVAWGVTNNICSLRDLYQEKTDPAHPSCYLFDGAWEPAKTREETIQVKGAEPVKKTIRSSRNGPIVDDILPAQARGTGPVSLRWVGAEPCGWLTALIEMNRAKSCAELREATRPWHVPTFNLVFADADGHIGHQCVGKIPIRTNWDRGYRPGWDPQHQWRDYIPFEGLPHLIDPKRGFVVTANNRVVPDDYPYPVSGTWSGGYRARRIRDMIEAQPKLTAENCQKMQLNIDSGRAKAALPPLIESLRGSSDSRIRQAAEVLKQWDCVVRAEAAAPALFNVFFTRWCAAVASERFPRETAGFVAANIGGLSLRLLRGDDLGWFQRQTRDQAILAAFSATLDELTTKLGPDMASWQWGRLHVLLQKHFLSGRGDLGTLLDRSGLPLGGDGNTVNSSTPDPNHAAWLGAGYRMVTDFADPKLGMWSVEAGSVSGHPGSQHYDDQLEPWSAGKMHYTSLVAEGVEGTSLGLIP
ncbi:MAG: penicillin acylase family protein [Gemmataceae bacterium]|nr:penicillin acylase family protein [Gemmataceae bacterium]